MRSLNLFSRARDVERLSIENRRLFGELQSALDKLDRAYGAHEAAAARVSSQSLEMAVMRERITALETMVATADAEVLRLRTVIANAARATITRAIDAAITRTGSGVH